MASQAPSVYDGKDGDELKEINERYDYAFSQWDPVRQEGAKDTRYVAGNPWDDDERNARLAAGRPVIASDELAQYENPLVNSVRENRRSVKFTPVGNGANDKTAELYQNKFRETEARSRGQVAFTTAFQNCVERSYGWARLSWRYASPTSMRRELVIDAMPNPDMVTPDPDFTTTTASDMRYCFVEEMRSHDEFLKEFPKAEIRDFGSYTQAHSKWVGQNRVKLAEYWCIKHQTATLLRLLLPDRSMKDVLEADAGQLVGQPGVQVLKDRETTIPKVEQILTNGLEILKRTNWVGSSIPLAACLGKIIWLSPAEANMGVSGRTAGQLHGPQRLIMSMTRLARDPYMLLCYIRSCQAELVGMTPKVPYFVRRGSLLPKELLRLQNSLQQPTAVIEVENDIDGRQVEFPQRNPYEPAIAPLEMLYESARRSIQAAMAQSFLPTDAQRQNQKSGIALDKITAAAQKGSYHFIDHYEDFQIRIGELYQDAFDKIYDDEDDLAIILPDGTNKTVRVNGQPAEGQDEPLSTKGDHAVTISTGPSFDSDREAANDFADTLVGNINIIAQVSGPQVAAQILSLSIKLKDLGVLGDQMAEIISPKPLQDGEQPTPEQVQQVLEKMKATVQQLEQEKAQMQQALQTDQVKEQAQTERVALVERNKLEIAQLQIQKDLEIARHKSEADLVLQQVKDQHEVSLAAAKVAQDNLNREDEQAHEVSMATAEAALAEADREDTQRHDTSLAAAEAADAAEQAERAHEQGVELLAAEPKESSDA